MVNGLHFRAFIVFHWTPKHFSKSLVAPFHSCTYFSPCRGAFKWMWCRCAFSPLSMFPFIQHCSTVALDVSLTPSEVRECSSSAPGVWLWYLPPANDSGTVSKNDYDAIKSKTKWAAHTRTNHLNSWFNPFFFNVGSWFFGGAFFLNLGARKHPRQTIFIPNLDGHSCQLPGHSNASSCCCLSPHHLLDVAHFCPDVLGFGDPQRPNTRYTIQCSFF